MRTLALLFLAVIAAGCVDTASPDPATTTPTTTPAPMADCAVVAPSGAQSRPGVAVSNQPGAFSYSGSIPAGTGKEEWAWQNAAPAARASWSGQTASGTLRLTLMDACGKEVLKESFAPGQQSVSKTTGAGVPGAWLVRLEMTMYTGQLSLSVTSG